MPATMKIAKRRSVKLPVARSNSARSSPGVQPRTKASSNGNARRPKSESASPRLQAAPEPLEEKQQFVDPEAKQPPPRYHDDMLKELEERGDADSICEDFIGSSVEDCFFPDIEGACTRSESMQLRRLLREVGPIEFLRRTMDSGIFTAEKLLTAFSVRPPECLQGAADKEYFPYLTLAMTRELQKRAKLQQYNTIDDAVDLIKRSKNIIVLTGAGISTSLGIPDFRSADTGLYSMLGDLGLDDPQQVFDLSLFHEDPSIFYSIARKVLPDHDRCSPTHSFIAMLQAKGKLLTNYTQNIDNIEETAGIDPDRLVQCHGSWSTASCIRCGHRVPGKTIFPIVRAGGIPACPKCAAAAAAAAATATSARSRPGSKSGRRRKRRGADDDSEDYDDDDDGTYVGRRLHPSAAAQGISTTTTNSSTTTTTTTTRRRTSARNRDSSSSRSSSGHGHGHGSSGVMKPDITFFGEALPRRFGERLLGHDRDRADLVIVLGTSLKVKPVSELVQVLPANVPQIYISRDPVAHVHFDIDLLGDCDVVVAELCRRAAWPLVHPMLDPAQSVAVELEDGYWSRYHIRAVPAP